MNDNIEVVNLEDKAKSARKGAQKDRKQQRGKPQQRGGQRLRQAGNRRGNNNQQPQNQNQKQNKNQNMTNNQNNRNRNNRQQNSLMRRTGNRSDTNNQNQQNRQEQYPQRQRPQKQQSNLMQQQTVISFDPEPNVIIKGLGDFMTDQKLREICQGYGALDMCKLDRDSFGNVKPQGIGLIRFERPEDGKKIVRELNGARIVEGQENQSSGGQVSVKYIEPGENWQSHIHPQGVLPVMRRAPFKIGRNRRG